MLQDGSNIRIMPKRCDNSTVFVTDGKRRSSNPMMNYLRTMCRFQAALQLLPALESGEETLVGGQAVLEGVMMRTPHAWGIAVRQPSGEMLCHREPLERAAEKRKWLGWPMIRGLVTLGQAMGLGFRALRFSSNVALAGMQLTGNASAGEVAKQKEVEIPSWMVALNLIFSIGFFILMYKFVPLLAATGLKRHIPALGNSLLFNLTDGAVRIAIFLIFIWGISRWRDIHRVFQYHGAEHKTVFAFEDGNQLTIGNAQKFSTYHPRCGTSFLMTVMLISIVVYALVPATTFWGRFAARIALLPVIASLSYEMIRLAARLLRRRQSSGGQNSAKGAAAWSFILLTRPGMWLQRITTQPPEDGQVECAIRALEEALALERERGGELVIA
jgi:uncharacterized protein YqhQ